MTTMFAEATQQQPTSWQDVVMFLGLLAFMALFFWLIFRD